MAVLVFWSLQWSDSAPEGRLVSWAFTRPVLVQVALGLHGLLVALILARIYFSKRGGPVLRRVWLAGIGLLTAAAVLGAANRALLLSGDDLLSAKLRQYEQIADKVDTVFIGSSRIYRHLDPVVYDRLRAERGGPGLSFNLGVPDMRMLEVLYLAEWAFERSEGVELLIIEATADPLELPEWNRKSERTVAWHDEKAMARIRRGVAQLEASEEERASVLAAHLEPFERRLSAVGRGLRLVDSEEWPGLPAAQRGYQSLEQNQRHPISDEEATELTERWNRLHERPGDWRRTLGRLERQGAGGFTTDPFEQELFAELEALAAEHGSRVLWLVSPAPIRSPNLIAAHEKGVVRKVLRFDDPERYPEFYRASGRFDRHHLNREMAARMTTLVAQAVLDEATAAP